LKKTKVLRDHLLLLVDLLVLAVLARAAADRTSLKMAEQTPDPHRRSRSPRRKNQAQVKSQEAKTRMRKVRAQMRRSVIGSDEGRKMRPRFSHRHLS